MYNNQLSARQGHFGLPSSFCLQMRRAHGSMFADDRPHTTRTARRHARIGGESVSLISRHKFARIARRNISDRISACSHGLSRLSRHTDIRFATQPYIPITHHLPRHPCPFSRTTIIYNTSTYLCTLRNVSHIAHCTITHLIPSPPTLSIRPGVISRVSVAALCPILPCIAFHILHAKSHLKGGGAHARRLLKVRGSYHEFSNASSRGYPFDTGYSLGIPRVPKSDCFGFWDPNATGFTPGTPGSPGDNF